MKKKMNLTLVFILIFSSILLHSSNIKGQSVKKQEINPLIKNQTMFFVLEEKEDLKFRNYEMERIQKELELKQQEEQRLQEEQRIKQERIKKEEDRKKNLVLSRGGNLNNYIVKEVNIKATAYTFGDESNGKGNAYLAASGKTLKLGFAAGPKDLPFGTIVDIEGYGNVVIEDRGSDIVRINDNTIRIDILLANEIEVEKFGVKTFKGFLYIPRR